MDQFAFHDIPDSIDYILGTTYQTSVSYIGFSQGTAQAFATLSIHPTLNDKVDLFIALAPAMSPAGLRNYVVDSIVKASPQLLFLAFGRRSMLGSAAMWQSILYPPYVLFRPSIPIIYQSTTHSSLQELSTNIRFPDLGAEDKKMRKVNSFAMVPISDS